MIDSHCHLNLIDDGTSVDELINEAAEAGVHTILEIGTDLEASSLSVELAQKHDSVYAVVGVHPHDAKTVDDSTIESLKELALKKKVVAIGEIGLDFYRDYSPRKVQEAVFRKQLELAAALKMPVVIHTRKAFDETVEIVKGYARHLPGGVFHCFPGTIDDAHTVFDLGFVISVGGVITFDNAKMADVARQAPLDRIILETDAPYLAPAPHRGKTNRPAYVKHVYDRLAALRGIEVAEVEKKVDRTCQKLFGLVETFEG